MGKQDPMGVLLWECVFFYPCSCGTAGYLAYSLVSNVSTFWLNPSLRVFSLVWLLLRWHLLLVHLFESARL